MSGKIYHPGARPIIISLSSPSFLGHSFSTRDYFSLLRGKRQLISSTSNFAVHFLFRGPCLTCLPFGPVFSRGASCALSYTPVPFYIILLLLSIHNNWPAVILGPVPAQRPPALRAPPFWNLLNRLLFNLSILLFKSPLFF
jgi:hypothetical protein